MSYMILLYSHYYQVRHIMITFLNAISFNDTPVRRPPFNIQEGGGVKFLSRANYLFQPGLAGCREFRFLVHVYIEQLLK